MELNSGKGVGNTSLYDKCNSMEEFCVKLQFEPVDTCLLYLKNGKLFLDDMTFHLGYISQLCPTIVPAVVLTQNTETIMSKCEIIGNKKYATTGLIAKYCDLIIRESKIHNC